MSALENIFTDIANAIRMVDDTIDPINPSDMATRIAQLTTIGKINNPIPQHYMAYAIEAAQAAESYHIVESNSIIKFVYASPWNQDTDINDVGFLDNISWILLVLTGYSFQHSRYYYKLYNGISYVSSPYNWADTYLTEQSKLESGKVRTVKELELYMYMCGRTFDDIDALNIGDIVFFNNNTVGMITSVKNNIPIVLIYDENGWSNIEMLSNDDIKTYARPIYDQNFLYPQFDEKTNLLSYPWVFDPKSNINVIDNLVLNGQDETIYIKTRYIESNDDIVISLRDENIPIILEPGTYTLEGAPRAATGMIGYVELVGVLGTTNHIYTDVDSIKPVEFILTEQSIFSASIRIVHSDPGTKYTWTPRLYRIS